MLVVVLVGDKVDGLYFCMHNQAHAHTQSGLSVRFNDGAVLNLPQFPLPKRLRTPTKCY